MFVNLNVLVINDAGAPIVDAGVYIGRDYGNGRSRTTDGNGFANFGVEQDDLAWQVSAAGYGDHFGTVHVGFDDVWLNVVFAAIVAPPPPPPPPPPPAPPPEPTPPPAPAPAPAPSPAPAPAPAPSPAPAPAPAPGTFVNLNAIVTDTNGHAIMGALVELDTDFGNGALRTTDGNGFANFGVWLNASIGWGVEAVGYTTVTGRVVSSTNPTTLFVTLAAAIAPPAPVPPGPGGGGPPGAPPPVPPLPPSPPVPAGQIGELTPAPTGLEGTPAAPRYTAVKFETRGGVPSFTAESFSALDIPTFGITPGGILQSIAGAIISLFKGSSGNADLTRLAGVVQKIGDLLLKTVSTVADLASRSVHTDTQAGNIFSHILSGVLGPIINALAAVIRGGSGDLAKLLGPISDALKKVLDKVRHLYDKWLKPILHIIDVTRQLLRVLAAFHLDFARDLDAQLGKLEGKLTAPYLKVVSEINKTRNVVNRIVTLDGALQRVTLLESMVKHKTCVQRAIDQAPMAEIGSYPNKLPPRPVGMNVEEWRAGLLSGRAP